MKNKKTRNEGSDRPFTHDPAHCVSVGYDKIEEKIEYLDVCIVIYRRSAPTNPYYFPKMPYSQENLEWCSRVARELNRESRPYAW